MDNLLFWKELGQECRRERIKRSLGLNQLARILNISNAALSRFETGKRAMGRDATSKVLAYLGVQIRLDTMKRLEQRATCPSCLNRFTVKVLIWR